MMDYEHARTNMVDSQLRSNGVTHTNVIAAFEEVPREVFLPESKRGYAYIDEDLRLQGERYLMEARVLARLIQAAEPEADDVALVVGCNTGYSVAVLARLAATVISVEEDEEMASEANRLLEDLSVNNAVVLQRPLREGCPDKGPYNVIVVDGAVEEIPKELLAQLADRGRLTAVVKDGPGLGKGTYVIRVGDSYSSRILFDAGTPVLPGFEKPVGFVFKGWEPLQRPGS